MVIVRNLLLPGALMVLGLSVLPATGTHAQQQLQPADLATEAEVEEIRRYSVELIIFEYRDQNAVGTEIFPPDELPPAEDLPLDFILEMGDATTTVATETGSASDPAIMQDDDFAESMESERPPFSAEELILGEIPGPHQVGLKVMDPSEYSLDEIYEKLVELDAYTPLMRSAWTQITVEEEATQPIKLRRLGDPPLKLDGNVTLYLSRYLHLVLDLALEERTSRTPVDPVADFPVYGDSRGVRGYEYNTDSRPATGPVYYRIQEDRIVRNGELRYYDHPKFGVVAKITRVEENPLQPGETARDIDALTSDSN